MTIKDCLSQAQEQLAHSNIDSAQMDAELLLAHLLDQNRAFLLAHPELELNQTQLKQYSLLINQRAQHQPVAYITGTKEFYGLNFTVNPAVLIPRPETELMVEEVIHSQPQNSTIIDLGTGSGCIIISLAKYLNKLEVSQLKRSKEILPETSNDNQYLAIDISDQALSLAKLNAQQQQLDAIEFINGDLLKPILNNQDYLNRLKAKQKIIITANLPYLDQTWPELLANSNSADLKHEPELALAGGSDGLDYYRQLAEQLIQLKKITNQPITVYCEIYKNQSQSMKDIFNFAKSVIKKNDLAGLDRLIIVEL